MREINCNIIQDILPLYVDEVVSDDTKEMVDEHLQHCGQCQKEYVSMKQDFYMPVENKVPHFNTISKKWRKKKWMISIGSIVATAIILMGTFSFVFYYETVIPYSKNFINIEIQNDNQLVSHYYGKSYATVYATHPMSLEIDGEKKNVSFIHYTKTIADSPSRNLINNEKSFNEQDYIFALPESEKIDAVYYVDFDFGKIAVEKESWDAIIKRAELIWEK